MALETATDGGTMFLLQCFFCWNQQSFLLQPAESRAGTVTAALRPGKTASTARGRPPELQAGGGEVDASGGKGRGGRTHWEAEAGAESSRAGEVDERGRQIQRLQSLKSGGCAATGPNFGRLTGA